VSGTLSLPASPNLDGGSKLLYNPYQQAFLQALNSKREGGGWAFNRLSLFAGRRGGKTEIGAVAAVLKAAVPKANVWVCAPTYPDLNDFVMPAFFKHLPVEWIADYKASFQTLVLKNDTRVVFRSLDDPNKGRGPALDFAWLDETRKIQQLAWDTIMPALTDREGQAIFTTTPNGFDWCYRRLWKTAEEGEPGFWACQYRTIENPLFSSSPSRLAEVEAQRRQMDPLFFAQEFEADFVTFAGRIYDLEKQILRTDAQIRTVIPEWPRVNPDRRCIVGLDPGADHPFAGVLILKTEKGLVCVGEHLLRNKPVAEHVRELQKILARWNPLQPFRPEAWAIDRSQRQTLIELSQYGIFCRQAENKVVDGIRRVQAWLEAGQLFFVDALVPTLIQQMRSYRWAENKGPDGQWRKEAVWKEDDDLPDALRYAVMTWPELPEADMQPSGGLRDISNFPEEVRWALERQSRLGRVERGEEEPGTGLDAPEPNNPLGEFYGTESGRGFYLDDDE
jgi:hypothetical protein